MLQLLPSELTIIEGWAATSLRKHGIPLPEENEILNKIKKTGSSKSMFFKNYELEVMLMWADESIKNHYGGSSYIMDPEKKLIDKIHQYVHR